MISTLFKKTLWIGCLSSAFNLMAQLPVINSHPRVFLDNPTITFLKDKVNSNSADWQSIKQEADDYAVSTVLSWDPATANAWGGNGTIFYSYCGSSYEDAALTLGLAHQMTKSNNTGANPTIYSDKLLELADEILLAYSTWPPGNAQGNIFDYNTSYATRHMGKVVGIIYDWCYDELGASRKAAFVAMMENWFDYMRVPLNVYQGHDHATGNYFFGHVLCAAYMGYALGSDSPKSNAMIAFARQRILGTTSADLLSTDYAEDFFAQSFKGGLPSAACRTYLGPSAYTGAPQRDGIPIQGWAYGGTTTETIIDYCYMVKSATNETVADSMSIFFKKTAEALVHAHTPNRFQVDNSNDQGSFLGSVASYSLPLRLSAVLEGTPEGEQVNYFHQSWIKPVNLVGYNPGYPSEPWESFFFEKTRPQTAFDYKPYYPTPEQNTYQSIAINDGLHKYYMRSDWGEQATWITYDLASAYYDDHQHNNAGHLKIIRGSDYDADDLLLVGSNEVGSAFNGVEGETNYAFSSNFANTLFLDDWDDYNSSGQVLNTTVGGQFGNGFDQPSHVEQNDDFSYFRADLTSAYYLGYYIPDTSERTLNYFLRSMFYLRDADVVMVYDQLQAKNSTHVNGQYKKHLRWHFLEEPVVNGNKLTATFDESKLHMHTVLPATVQIDKVDESSNPDNVFGTVLDYLFNTGTWRAEVSVPGNPLKQDFLTVFQPGDLAESEMTTTALINNEQTMDGTLISLNGKEELVFFSRQTNSYPTPISQTSYAFSGSDATWHNITGLSPNTAYKIDASNASISISEDPTGQVNTTPSGVLRFRKMDLAGLENPLAARIELYPNPARDIIQIKHLPQDEVQLVLLNQAGQQLSLGSSSTGQAELNIRHLEAGIYLLHIEHESFNKTVKIVKM